MCSKRGFDDLAEQLINNGSSVDSCRAAILERIDAKPVETAKPIEAVNTKRKRTVCKRLQNSSVSEVF